MVMEVLIVRISLIRSSETACADMIVDEEFLHFFMEK